MLMGSNEKPCIRTYHGLKESKVEAQSKAYPALLQAIRSSKVVYCLSGQAATR